MAPGDRVETSTVIMVHYVREKRASSANAMKISAYATYLNLAELEAKVYLFNPEVVKIREYNIFVESVKIS